MKTVAQIAKEIGVSKQAVFYRIKKPPLSNALQSFISKDNGILMVAFDGEILIKSAFNVDTVKHFDDKRPSKEDTSFDSEIVKMLKENMAVLHKQLEIKDIQIEEQQKTIKELTATVRTQAESINADRKNELAETLIDGQMMLSGDISSEESKEKVSFFSRIFKKKKH